MELAQIVAVLGAMGAYTLLIVGLVKWLAGRVIKSFDDSLKDLRDALADIENTARADRAHTQGQFVAVREELHRDYPRRIELDHRLLSIEANLQRILDHLIETARVR